VGPDHAWDRLPTRAMDPEILRAIGVTGYAVLGVLAHHADREGRCWPGIERIMMILSIRSDRTVHGALNRLEAAGLILRRRRTGKPTEYRLIFTPAVSCGGAGDCGAQEIAGAQGDAPTPAADCATPPQPVAGEPDTRTRYKNQSTSHHHPAPSGDCGAQGQGRDDAEGEGDGYVEEVLAAYTGLPMTPDRATERDSHLARRWRDQGVPIDAVRAALVLATTRWVAAAHPVEPVKHLAYFDGPVQESFRASDPDWWAYTAAKLERIDLVLEAR